MAAIDNLKTWFQRDVKFAVWDENVVVDETDPAKTVVRFYTDTNEYVMTILPQGEETPKFECVARSRKTRAGQEAPRTRPLWRGQPRRLNERMWRRLQGAMLGLELVRVHRRDAAAPGTEKDEAAEADIGAAAE